jgi:predicted transcriptional regulator
VGTLRAKTGAQKRFERVARVLGSVLRIRIMAALSLGPMSPMTIHRELDGEYEVSTIDKNLKVLERYGWVELIDIRTGGARRGGAEHVYRAIELPIFDDIIWFELPLAMREMASWGILEGLVTLLKNAWVSGTLEAGDDPHTTYISGFVDQLGWNRIIARVNGLCDFFLEELGEASLRMAASGEQPTQTLVALAFFEPPSDGGTRNRLPSPLMTTGVERSKYSLYLRMAKAMINPLCRMVLSELSTRAMSAKMFSNEFGGKPIEGLFGERVTKNAVYRAFRKLKEFDWLVLVDADSQGKGPRGQEHFYRAIRPPISDDSAWPALPESMKGDSTGKALWAWIDCIGEAIRARTMDARVNRHFTWTPGGLDQLGLERTVERGNELSEFVRGELKGAAVRLEESDEQPIPMTVAIAIVESAVASTRVDPGPPLV